MQSLRLLPDLLKTQQVLQSGALGELVHCRVAYAACVQNQQNGALLDLMPHVLDLLHFWLGEDVLQQHFSMLHKDALGRHVIVADFNAACTFELEANFFAQRSRVNAEFYGARESFQVSCEVDDAVSVVHKELAFQPLSDQDSAGYALQKWIYAELDRLGCEHMLLA